MGQSKHRECSNTPSAAIGANGLARHWISQPGGIQQQSLLGVPCMSLKLRYELQAAALSVSQKGVLLDIAVQLTQFRPEPGGAMQSWEMSFPSQDGWSCPQLGAASPWLSWAERSSAEPGGAMPNWIRLAIPPYIVGPGAIGEGEI